MNASGVSVVLMLVVVSGACGGAPERQADSRGEVTESSAEPLVTGQRTFVIVPEQSTASYRASEEFFGGALNLLGIEAGKLEALGTTQAIEGRFDFDPERPNMLPGTNEFSVRVNTFVSNQSKRDDYLREVRDDGGPSFDKYPVATFKATGIEGTSRPTASGRELNLKLNGDLTIREITRPATFDVTAQLVGAALTGTATTRVPLSAFGIGPIEFVDILEVADVVTLEVKFTARAQ